MMRFRATIHVLLKPDVADVQGIAIQQALARHGDSVSAVRAGKYFELELDAENEAAAKDAADRLANGTFSNPVIERYWLEVTPA